MTLALAVLLLGSAAAPPRTLSVAPGSALPTVTAALAQARDGDTIVVAPGEYRERGIVVGRRVTIIGRDWPVFRGGAFSVFTVTADSVTLRGLVIREVTPSTTEDRAGIRVVGAAGCRIEDNTLLDSFFGIYLSKVNGCVVRGNRVRGSGSTEALSGNAIHSWSSTDLVVEDNVLRGHRDGIYFEFTSGARVRRNLSTHQLRYGLHFMFSNGCEYADNTFADNHAGVAVMYSHDVTMTGNRFERS